MDSARDTDRAEWYLAATPGAVSQWLVRLWRTTAAIDVLVVVTAFLLPSGTYGSIATAVEGIKLGAATYLTKPVDADQILAAFNGEMSSGANQATYAVPSLARVEWEHIQRVLADCGGNLSQAARLLGIRRGRFSASSQRIPCRRLADACR